MTATPDMNACDQTELVCAYVMQALPAAEATAVESHLIWCERCRRELETLRPVIGSFVYWPIDMLSPTTKLQKRLAHRIADETGKEPVLPTQRQWSEPEWEEVSPGIFCKLLSADTEKNVVSMLV